MKRERSTSFLSLPCLNSDFSVAVCRPHQNHLLKQKRLCYGSSVNKSNGARNNSENGSINKFSIALFSQRPIAPTSTSMSPLMTPMHFAEIFVDPSTVSPSEANSLAEEMAADIYSELSIMYDMLSDILTPTTESCAVDELMRRLHKMLNANYNERTDVVGIGRSFSTQVAIVRDLYNGLIRVFIFLYQRFYRAFVVLEVSELLAASWQRFLAFVVEYRILDEAFVREVYDYAVQIVQQGL